MDYKVLLSKYIEHVKACEGISFISHIGWAQGSDSIRFTPEEEEELNIIEESLNDKGN